MFAFQSVHNTKAKATEQNKKPKQTNPNHPEKLSKENSWSENKIFNLKTDTNHTI